jgi:HK97 gp10 family phage protein
MGSAPIHVEGLKELDEMLGKLSKSMAKTVLRNALKKAGVPIRDSAAAMAPVDRGGLSASLTVSPKLKKSQKPGGFRDRTAVNVYVGPDAKRAPHAHLVEFGTAPHTIIAGLRRKRATGKKVLADGDMIFGKVAQHPGATAKPFMRPAFDENKEKALDILVKEIAAELVKAVKRLRKRAETGKLGKAQLRALQR